MIKTISAFAAGLLFGLGLVVSQMIDPAKVLGFLTLGPGWDPSLAFVMGGAVLVTAPGYLLVRRRSAPLFERKFFVPEGGAVDARLASGAGVFGLGWGLAGFCPGPAIAAASVGGAGVWTFLAAMVAGTLIAERPLLPGRTAPPDEEGAARPA